MRQLILALFVMMLLLEEPRRSNLYPEVVPIIRVADPLTGGSRALKLAMPALRTPSSFGPRLLVSALSDTIVLNLN